MDNTESNSLLLAGLPETKSYEQGTSARIFWKTTQIPLCKLSLFLAKSLLSKTVSLSVKSEKTVSAPQVHSGSGSPSEITDGGTKIYLERGTCYCFIKLSGNIFKLCLKTTKTFICQNILTWKCMNYWSVAILDVIFWDCCFYWNSINFMVLLNFSD